jgi:hypothetical protein
VNDVSAFGTSVTVVATKSFPSGFKVTQFADEVDPVSVEPMEPSAYEILIDVSLFFYQKGAPIKVSISVIAGTPDDENLRIILNNRKGTKGVIALPDTCTLTVSYPNGSPSVFTGGGIISGPPADSVQAGAGRRKSNTYTFAFGEVGGTGSNSIGSKIGTALGVVSGIAKIVNFYGG